jgi:hypothetical protein
MCELSGSDIRQMQGIDHNEGQGAHNNASEPWPQYPSLSLAPFQDLSSQGLDPLLPSGFGQEASEFMDDSMYDNEGQGQHNSASEPWSQLFPHSLTPTINAIQGVGASFQDSSSQGLGPVPPSNFDYEGSEFIDHSMYDTGAPALGDNGDFLPTENDVHASTRVETAIGGCDSVICPLFRQNPYLHFHCLDEGKLRYISYLL